MFWVVIAVVLVYLVYRLVKAVERTQVMPVQSLNTSPDPSQTRQQTADVAREDAARDVLATFAKLESEYLELRRGDFIDGGHARDCYIASTREIRTLLNRLKLGTSVLLEGALKEPDMEELKRTSELLASRAEADVRERVWASDHRQVL